MKLNMKLKDKAIYIQSKSCYDHCLSLCSLFHGLSSFRLDSKHVCRSQASNLLDEECHLILLYCSASVLVKFFEALVEVLLIKLIVITAVGHLFKGVLDELLRLILVECTRVVFVVGAPNVLDYFSDEI